MKPDGSGSDPAEERHDPTLVIEATLNLPQRVVEAYESDQNSHARRDRLRLLIETFTLLAVVSGSIAAVLTLKSVNRSIVEARRSADAAAAAARATENQLLIQLGQLDIAREANVQDKAAIDAANKTAADELAGQREAMRLERRAWVGIVGIRPIRFQVGQTGEITHVVRNTGQTPALRMSAQVWFEVQEANAPLLYKPRGAFVEGGSVLQPGAEENFPAIRIGNRLTESAVQDVRNGKIGIYVFGRIRYSDIFGRVHITSFCGMLKPPELTSTVWCSQYNDAD